MSKFGQKLFVGALSAYALNLLPAEAPNPAVAEVSQERMDIVSRYASCTILDATTTAGVAKDVSINGESKRDRDTLTLTLQLGQSAAGLAAEQKYRHDNTVGWEPAKVVANLLDQTPDGQIVLNEPSIGVTGTPANFKDPEQNPNPVVRINMYPRDEYEQGEVIGVGISSEAWNFNPDSRDFYYTSLLQNCGSVIRTDAAPDDPGAWAPSGLSQPQLPPITKVQ
jgi:hypothetical protein